MIQINPLKSYIDGGVRAAITTPPSASLVFDLPGKAIWVKGVKLKGTDHTYTFSHDNYITLTNTPDSNESEDIKIGVNTSALKNAIDTTYGVVSTTANGLAPKFTSGNKQAASAATTYYFLGWTGTTLKWYQAPFRNIRINSETTDRLGVNSTDPLIISSGNGISVTWDSTNKKIVITNTKPDINHNTHYTTMLYIGENNDTKANKNVANPYLKLFDDNTRRATFQIKAGSGIAVASDANGNIIITNSSPDVNHNTDRTGIKLATVSGTKKTDSTLILANSTTGLNIQGGTNKFLIGNGTNYIEVPVVPSVSNKDATIGTTLTTLATVAGVDIKAKIASYSLSSHTHSVKINGSIKTIATSGAIDLGSYLPLSGGTMIGNILFSGDNNITWSRNSDSAKIYFKNTGDSDSDSYLGFETSDNGNEYFKFGHTSGSTHTEWMSIKSDGVRVKGTKVSLEGHTHSYLSTSTKYAAGDSVGGSANYLRWEAASSSSYARKIPISWADDVETTTTRFRATYSNSLTYRTDTNTISSNISGNASTATTATNLSTKPSIQVGTSDTKKITVTAGGKTSDEYTVPFAIASNKLYAYNIAASTDVNTLKDFRYYVSSATAICSSIINGPEKRSNGEMWFLSIPAGSSSYGQLLYYSRSSTNWQLWTRTWANDSFSPWVLFIHSGNISSQSVNSATYASNVGTAGTVGTNYVTASKVIATCNWYDTMIGSDTDTVINRWSEIVAFVANFKETPDLATYLSNNYLAKSGGTMIGPLKWANDTALPVQTSPKYFVCIDEFTNGGTTKYASKTSTLKALTGLTSAAIGNSDEPIYWNGTTFVKANAYPTKASWNYDDVYSKLGHTHDDRYYTESEINTKLAGKAASSHTHTALMPERFDTNAPAPNSKYGLTFQFSYNLGTDASNWWNVLNMRSYTDSNYTSAQIITPAYNPGKDTGYSGNMKWRQGRNSTWLDWKTIIDSSNYTNYINTTNFPGLNKVGTVTSVTVTGANGLSGTGTITTSGTITLSNAGVRSTTINGNYLRVNTNGTNTDLTIPYATTASQLNNTSVSDPNTAASGLNIKWYSQINAASGYAGTNYGFPVSNNANGILWLGTHSGTYGWLLGFSSNSRIYARYISNNTFPKTANGGSWNRIAWTTDIPTSLKNPNTLTLQAGTFAAKTYDGSTAVTVNIPTHTSHLVNNSGFLTSHLSLANYVTLNTAQTITGAKTFSNNLTLNASNEDRYITFNYTGGTGYDWRIGYLGSGEGDANYFVILSDKTDGTYVNALKIGLTTLASIFEGTVKASKFITNNGKSTQFVKGDGSLDSNTYATTALLSLYLPLNGTASSATKLTSSAGNTSLPVYFLDGKPVACNKASIFSNLSNNGNDISITIAGLTRTLTVGYAQEANLATSAGYADEADDADTVDGYHASNLVKFYLSPMASNASADSAKSWFVNTMPSGSGAIVYNVPGSEKTIIAGKSTGSHGHMLQLNYDDKYLRILRYLSGSWKTTDWEKISAGYADNADMTDGLHVHGGRNNEANKIVRTDGSGYIQAGWINTTSDDMGTTTINKIYCSNDGYIRYKTPANFFSTLANDSNLLSITVGSLNRKLTVAYASNADTVDGVHLDWSRNYTEGNYLAIWDNAGNCIRPIPKGSASVGYASKAGSVAWNSITGKPSSFTPSAHNHDSSYVSSLTTSGNSLRWVKNGSNNDIIIPYAANAANITGGPIKTLADPGVSLLIKSYGLRSDYTSAGYPTEEYLKAWCKYAYANCSGKVAIGYVNPNSRGFIFADIYSSGINNSSGLPEHITGRYYPHGGNGIKFGTSYGTWYYDNTDTNTWRGIQDNLTSTSTADSLSANQGRLLANGSARDNTKLPLSGGTMTGPIKFSYNNNGNCNVSRTSGFSMFYGNQSGATNYGFPFQYSSIISFMTGYCGMLFANYGGNGDTRLLFRNISDLSKWTNWYHILHSGNSSVTKSGQTITVTINGTSQSLTNSTYNFSGASFTSGNYNTAEHNANNITSNGVWYYTSNGPTTSLGVSTNDGALYSQAYNTNWVGQIALDYRNGNLFVRGKNNGTWQAWRGICWSDNYALRFHYSNLSNSPTYLWATNSNGYSFLAARGSISVNYANSAGSASTVTINSSDANSTYRMVWHSGNTLYSTGGIYCNPSTDYLYASSMQTSNWFRSTGLTGWYNETYGGGWYMNDVTWIRTHNNKGIYTSTGTIYNAGHAWLATSSGYNVGIGTTSPSYKLHVVGDSSITGSLYANYLHVTNTVYAEDINANSAVYTSDVYTYDISVENNVNADGCVYATHFYEKSDIRYKKILRNLSINSNTIANLPLFDFEWIENNTIGTGTSALAVLLILPNIVSGTDKLTLDYGVLGTIAGITACKELVTLKSELLLLKEKVKLLEDKLRKYENI